MGHSAGGHLALLYAYMSAEGATVIDPDDETKNIEFHDVQLVISEAGPTQFATYENVLVHADSFIYAMAGTTHMGNGYLDALSAVSPINYVNSSSPYTILAYGKVINDKDEVPDSDGVVPYSQAEVLETCLLCNGVWHNKCTLYGVGHNDFGEYFDNGVLYIKTVHPKNPDSAIQDYYNNILTQLIILKNQ